jgi:multisubunit Na+/H+ antiporter MnhG subunit
MFNWLNQEILFWTFSTIAQTFGAILALIGALSIFKMQILQNDFRNLINELRKWNFIEKPNKETDEELYNRFKKITKDNLLQKAFLDNQITQSKCDKMLLKLEKYKENLMPDLKNKILVFSIINIIIIFSCLIGLIITYSLSSNISGFIFLILILLLCFFSLISSIKIIKYCLSI